MVVTITRDNNLQEEGWNSWVGSISLPQQLNEVSIEPPSDGLLAHKVGLLNQVLQPLMHDMADNNIIALWAHALAYARVIASHLF